MRLDAYYYGFDATGERAVDNVLSAVACAGKAFHHTDCWTEECVLYSPPHRGTTPVEWIQNAANDAAKELAALRKVAEAAESLVDEIRQDNRTDEEQEELCRAVEAMRALTNSPESPDGSTEEG